MIRKALVIVILSMFVISLAQAFGDSVRHSSGYLITTGMSKGELIKKVGMPSNQMTSQDISGGVREEWIYEDGMYIITVVIRNGRVVTVRKD